MRRYQIKQKDISIGDDFLVSTEDEGNIYFIDGYGFSFGKKLAFQDMRKNTLYMIRQRWLTFSPSYKIHRKGVLVATVRKKLLTFRHCFVLEIVSDSGREKFEIVGKTLEHEYSFHKGKELAATVSKKWLALTDTYCLEVANERLHQYFIAAAIIIDLICHDPKSKHNRDR